MTWPELINELVFLSQLSAGENDWKVGESFNKKYITNDVQFDIDLLKYYILMNTLESRQKNGKKLNALCEVRSAKFGV